MKVKIIGAGSIGNHLANASRLIGWDVVICDQSMDALRRTKDEIYPTRYGSWDEGIKLEHTNENNKSNASYDLVLIGTPPDSHIQVAIEAVKSSPKALLIEKPVSGLDFSKIDNLLDLAKKNNVRLFVGYDHIVSESVDYCSKLLIDNSLGDIDTIDVEFREHWGGIFNAHPWLEGPWDSYLGFSYRGGGALGEHSHALNLWQHFARVSSFGKVHKVQAKMQQVKNEQVDYDSIASLNLITETGHLGRCIQDVVTLPTKKQFIIQGKSARIECTLSPFADEVQIIPTSEGEITTKVFNKTRPDDFVKELNHIKDVLNGGAESPIDLNFGLDTMRVIHAAHKSNISDKTENIDYNCTFLEL
ncbi:Gfo/Idh/MocA family oxidoreductase [Gammaproteobacteria bacterium]|nr:Gfo/Idh/MocA family oxidoreductase [Gammaproteobacteria bacterium]